MAVAVDSKREISLNGVRYPIKGPLRPQVISQLPGKITIGDSSRTDQQYISEYVISDLRGGCGIKDMVEREHPDRFYDSDGAWTLTPGWITLPPLVQSLGPTFTVAPAKLQWFSSKLYVLGNNDILRYNTATVAWDDVGPTTDTGWQDFREYKNAAGTTRFYAASDTQYAYSTSGDAASWTTNARNGGWMGTFERKLLSANETDLSYSTDGTTWTEVLQHYKGALPNGMTTMRSPDGREEIIILAFNDGLFSVDFWTGQMYRLVDLSTMSYQRHGRGMLLYRDELFVPAQWQLLRVTGTTVVDMGLRARESVYPYESRIRCLTAVGNYLIAAAGATIFIWNGRGWHPIVRETSGDTIYALCAGAGPSLEADTTVNLYWAGGVAGAYYVHYCELPATGINPLDDATFKWKASTNLYMPYFDAGFSDWRKVAVSLKLYGEGMSANETVVVSYRTDNATSWTTLGTANSNGVTTLTFGSSLGVDFKKIQLRLAMARGSTNTNRPAFYAVLRAYLVPTTLYGWRVTIDCAHEYGSRTPEELIAALLTVIDTSTKVVLAHKNDADKYVKVMSMTGAEETGLQREGTYELLLSEMG